ncbi:MAG: alpha/beta hydrolase [Deltaproteobacteria bacterium]
MRTAQRLLIGAAVCYVLYGAVLTYLQRSIIFPRHVVQVPAEGGRGVEGETWWLDTPEGRVEAWFLVGEGRTADAPGPAVIFAHGNGEAIDFWQLPLARYRTLGVSVLLAEFRGYGRSAGEPSQESITSDYIAFYDRLVARPEVDAAKIVFHGRSLGGGVVGSLAAHRPCAAMILESTFLSIRSFAQQFLLPGFLVADPFDTEAVVRELQSPVLVLHGRRDTVVPYHHGETLSRVAKDAKLVTYDCGHNDMPSDDTYWDPVEAFVRPLVP